MGIWITYKSILSFMYQLGMKLLIIADIFPESHRLKVLVTSVTSSVMVQTVRISPGWWYFPTVSSCLDAETPRTGLFAVTEQQFLCNFYAYICEWLFFSSFCCDILQFLSFFLLLNFQKKTSCFSGSSTSISAVETPLVPPATWVPPLTHWRAQESLDLGKEQDWTFP